ncbi:MAG: hypothetical protein ABSF21_00070 [Dehalococcoidia bacterium]|jgi:hypothetical protein
MRYRARVTPLKEGRRQDKEARREYTHAVSVDQAGRFLGFRFPYPKYLVTDIVVDPEKEMSQKEIEEKWFKALADIKIEYPYPMYNRLDWKRILKKRGVIKPKEIERLDIESAKEDAEREREEAEIEQENKEGSRKVAFSMPEGMMEAQEVRLLLNKIRAAEVPEKEQGEWDAWSKLLDSAVEEIVKNASNCNLRYVLQTGMGEMTEIAERMHKESKDFPQNASIGLNLTDLEDETIEAVINSLASKCSCANITERKENY